MATYMISLGIGSPAAIPEFILFGLSPQPNVIDPDATVITVQARARTLTVRERPRVITVAERARTITIRDRS